MFHRVDIRFIVTSILLTALILQCPAFAGTSAGTEQAGLAPHTRYARYDFGTTPRVIDFGTQPLNVPLGVIAEVMKRDRVLRSELGKRGLEIRFHPFLKGDDIGFFMKQGKIDAAMAGDMPTIVAAASRDIVATALAKQGYTSIVAKGPLSVAELKGKRIGYPPVSTAHYMLLVALSSVGLEESAVRLVPMNVNDMADALAHDRIDAFAAWEPLPKIALKTISGSTIVYRYLNSSYLYFSRSLVELHPEAASLIAAAMVRALSWMRKREEHLLMAAEWALASEKQIQGWPVGLTAGEIATLTLRDIMSIASAPIVPEKDLAANGAIRRKFDFLNNRGKITSTATWDNVARSFDRGIIAGVLANPRRYLLASFDYDTGNAGR